MLFTNIIMPRLRKDNNSNRLKMGYFSQRKKHARENMFMAVSLLVVVIIYSVVWFGGDNNAFVRFLRGWQFHFYLFNIFLLLYTLWHRKVLYTAAASLLLVLNYASIAKTARLFWNDSNESTRAFNVVYKKGEQNYENIIDTRDVLLRRQGMARLSPNVSVSFMSFEKYDQVFTLVNVDFSKVSQSEKETAFMNLARFVDRQDDPVVIAGDFGLPSWSPLFREFLDKTGLSVKNRILFTDGVRYFAPFNAPTVNVLGYGNIGIRRLRFIPETKSFDIKLTF